jgi:hypothetical protein
MARETNSDLNEQRPDDLGTDPEQVRGVARDEEDFEDAEESDEEDVDDEEEGTF